MKTSISLCVFAIIAALCKFPPGFKFGASTTAFQIEGAWQQDGKAPSIWDNFAHMPNYTADGLAPDIAADSYNRYPEDIELLKKAGLKHYYMTIAWSRIVPQGRAGSPVNEKAVKRYREMFQALVDAGITPYVTLYHWDLPILLNIQGYGLVDKHFVEHYTYYARVSFERFGDLVKNWFTFNEPWCISVDQFHFKKRDEGTKPYLIGHNVLLAHASAVKLYREEFKPKQKGLISIVLNVEMHFPKDPKKESDIRAAKQGLDFSMGWFAEPIFFGDYPEIMKQRVGDRLPKFTEEQKAMIKGSVDLFILNHYTSYLAEMSTTNGTGDYWDDIGITTSNNRSWKLTDMGWPIVPHGIHDLLVDIHNRYLKAAGNMAIMVTENGIAVKEPTEKEGLNDKPRIDFMKGYLEYAEKAIADGVNLQGYFVWSLLDNFEWEEGFTKRFGLVRVEYTKNPTRTPKASFYWYKEFIKNNTVSEEGESESSSKTIETS